MFLINKYEYNDYEFIEIGNKDLRVTFCNLGASVFKILFNDQVMTLTPKNYNDFFDPFCFCGKIIGPFTNRKDEGIVKNNKLLFRYPLNEPTCSLHGGPRGFSTQKFFSELFLETDHVKLEYRLTITNRLDLVITYQVFEDHLDLSINALALNDTVCSLTNHLYFTLGTSKTRDLSLELKSKQYIITNERLIPTELVDIEEKHDFNELKKMEKIFVDNAYKLDEKEIKLQSNDYQVVVTTDFDYCQIFSDNFTDNMATLLSEKKNHRSVTIEPEDDLLSDIILPRGKTYERHISYKFSKIEHNEA